MKPLSQLFRLRLSLEPGEAADDVPSSVVELAAGQVKEIEAGRSGTFRPRRGPSSLTLTKTDLAAIAKNFDPKSEHKITLGHQPIVPETPDLGDVVGARYDEEKDRLFFSIKPTESLVEKNRKGEFHQPSMELTKRDDGTYDLGNLTVLGAHKPAIGDLARIELAGRNEETIFVCCAEGEDGEATLELAEPTAEQRRKWADEGIAMPDGSYYIRNRSDLENAVQAFGRSGNPAATKSHIIKRAKALGLTNLLPADWPGSTKKVAAASADEEDKVSAEKLELAEAENKRLKERLATAAANDAKVFLASEAVTKRVPMTALKAGGLERFLTALATMDAEGRGAQIELADGKSATLYEAAKQILLSFPEKLAGAEEEIATTDKAGDDTDDVQRVKLAGIDKESADLDFAARKEIQNEKKKGNEINYLEAVRRVEMARAR